MLRIGHAPHDHHAPLYIAAMKPDYFKNHGDIYLKEITPRTEYDLISGDTSLARIGIDSSTGGKELIRKLNEEYFDISFGGVPAILHFIDENNSIQILAPIMTEGAGLLVHKDFPANNWEEFVNAVQQRDTPVKIGYKTAFSVQNLIFERALSELNIPYSNAMDNSQAKVVGINLHGPQNMIPGLENRLIDGFVIMQPHLALAESKGIGKTIAFLKDLPPEGKWLGIPCCALAANISYVNKYPEASKALLTLLLRANRYITDSPGESAQLIAEWLQVPIEVEKKSIPTIHFTSDYHESWDRGIEFWVSTLVENGKLNNNVKEAYQQGRLKEKIYNRDLYDKARSQM
jgi:NitT/TauT family transport system substrate-binding protein